MPTKSRVERLRELVEKARLKENNLQDKYYDLTQNDIRVALKTKQDPRFIMPDIYPLEMPTFTQSLVPDPSKNLLHQYDIASVDHLREKR